MKPRRLFADETTQPSIDISPLLDVVFILLIFFVVSAVFVRDTGVEIERPGAISQTELPNKSILLALTANGEVWHGGSRIDLAGVAPLLAQQTINERHVIIQASRLASTAMLIDLVDSCKLAGASSVNVATEDKQ